MIDEMTIPKEVVRSNILKWRDYTPPVLHLEFLEADEAEMLWQVISAFEGAGVAFVVVEKGRYKKELLVRVFGIISKQEKKAISHELREIEALKKYSFRWC